MRWFKVAEISTSHAFALAIGLVVTVLTARVLGPEGRGMLVAVTAWVSFSATVAGLSIGSVVHHRIQARSVKNWLPDTLGTMLAIAGAVSLLTYVIIAALVTATEGELIRDVPSAIVALAFVMLPFIILENYGGQLAMASGRVRSYSLAQVVGRSVGIVVVFVCLMYLNLGIAGALGGLIVGQAIVALAIIGVLWNLSGGKVALNLTEMNEMLKGGAKLHLNTVGVFLITQVNILMLNHWSTKDEVALYQLGYQITTIMLIIPQGASMVLFSRLAQLGPDRLWPEQKRFGLQALGVIALVSFVAYLVAPFLIVALAGPEFAPSATVFRWLLPIVFGMSLAQLMAPQWIGRGIFVPTTILTICAGLANIGLSSVLIPKYGMMGAVWGILISYVGIVVVVQLCFAAWCEMKYRAANAALLSP